MAALVLSDRQIASVVSDLATGHTPGKVATRRHLTEPIVTEIGSLYGYPSITDLTRHSRDLNRKLRDAKPSGGLTVGGQPPTVTPAPSEDTGHVAECTECEYRVPVETTPGAWQLIVEHEKTHKVMLVDAASHPEPAAAPGTADQHAAAAQAQTVNSHDTAPVAAESPSLDLPATSEQHASAGSTPTTIGNGLGVVEEPPTPPAETTQASAATTGRWFAPGPRTVERLLDEARRIGDSPMVQEADHIASHITALTDLVEEWHTNRQTRILDELDKISERQAALLAELQAITGITTPLPATTPRGATRNTRAAAAAQPVQQQGLAAERQTGLWWQLDKEVRHRIRPWAVTNDVPHAVTGRQPAATIEAYLAAHPEDDPR